MKVLNLTSNKFEEKRYTVGCIVAYEKDIVEYGYCSGDDPLLVKGWTYIGEYSRIYIRVTPELKPYIKYSNFKGCYIFTPGANEEDLALDLYVYGRGGFPYDFEKQYEAVNCFWLFDNKQEVLNNVEYPLSKYLKYTFGVEFETYSGYIPEDVCFRDGLVPLRDGSLNGGIEYSTVVLEGNKGLNLLKQQVDTLKEYTYFNKECSLHFHFGNFPVNIKHIWALYMIWQHILYSIKPLVPEWTFCTSNYKGTGKDYCKHLPGFMSFAGLYKFIAHQKYFGDLYQPHPDDLNKNGKWNITSRYYDLNLVNMLCYEGPKTVEFRFLRPTFNYHKITLWMYVFNAILSFAETVGNNCSDCGKVTEFLKTSYYDLNTIIKSVYPTDLANTIINDLILLKIVIINQTGMNDFIGSLTEIEDKLINPNIVI